MQISVITKKHSMRKKLFGYMFVLATVLLLIFAIFLYMFGQFTTTENKVSDILSLQTEFFDREMTAYYNDITLRSARLSEKSAYLAEQYIKDAGIAADSIQNSPVHIGALEERYIDLLKEELLKVNCSGVFILFNASQTGESGSKAGVYLKQDLFGTTDKETMLLYRGNVQSAKSKGIMPHRKWHLEFDSSAFPNYDEILSDTSESLEKAVRICDIVILPGTSERVMLVALPVKGANGEIYGICGFEVNESIFKDAHAQPTTLSHITCVFSRSEDGFVNANEGLSCGAKNGYFLAPKDSLEIKPLQKGLSVLKNEHGSYIGMTRKTSLYAGGAEYAVTVMMPYADYSQMETSNTVQLVLVILLSGFTVLSLCIYFSKRFITPILKSLDKIKQSEKAYSDESQSGILEIDDLFAFLAEKDNEYQKSFNELSERNESSQNEISRIRAENDRLIKEHKSIVAQDDYTCFLSGIRNLTGRERQIFDLYLEGKTVPEIMQITEIKETTLKYHNGNIYSKLGVASKKQLLNFAAIYLKNEDKKS